MQHRPVEQIVSWIQCGDIPFLWPCRMPFLLKLRSFHMAFISQYMTIKKDCSHLQSTCTALHSCLQQKRQNCEFVGAQVDIPVPQAVEEVVHIPVTQTQARLRLSSCSCSFELCTHRRVLRHTKLLEYLLPGHHHQHVEQTVEVPVPMMQEEVVHVPKVR